MADPHVVTALVKKRAELAGLIEHLQSQVRESVLALDNVEATLRIFAPDIDLDEIAPRQVPTTENTGEPGAICTCTSTSRGSMPSNATL